MSPNSAAARVRAAIVDDVTVVREGFSTSHPAIEVVAAYQTIEPLLVERPSVDLVILDLQLDRGPAQGVRQGRPAIRAIAEAGYRICLYTEHRRPYVLAYCLRAGAHGIVHKSDSGDEATKAFRQVVAGHTVITQSLITVAEILQRHGRLPELTQKQLAVLHGRARGKSYPQIAKSMYITEHTAQGHMRVVNDKFAAYLSTASAAELERELGVAPGDLLSEGSISAGSAPRIVPKRLR